MVIIIFPICSGHSDYFIMLSVMLYMCICIAKKQDLNGTGNSKFYQDVDTEATGILAFMTFCMHPSSETEMDNNRLKISSKNLIITDKKKGYSMERSKKVKVKTDNG